MSIIQRNGNVGRMEAAPAFLVAPVSAPLAWGERMRTSFLKNIKVRKLRREKNAMIRTLSFSRPKMKIG